MAQPSFYVSVRGFIPLEVRKTHRKVISKIPKNRVKYDAIVESLEKLGLLPNYLRFPMTKWLSVMMTEWQTLLREGASPPVITHLKPALMSMETKRSNAITSLPDVRNECWLNHDVTLNSKHDPRGWQAKIRGDAPIRMDVV